MRTQSWWNRAVFVVVATAILSCGQKNDTAKPPQEDKAKQAVKEVITREFQYYEGAKQKLKETGKQEEQRRAQEKELE